MSNVFLLRQFASLLERDHDNDKALASSKILAVTLKFIPPVTSHTQSVGNPVVSNCKITSSHATSYHYYHHQNLSSVTSHPDSCDHPLRVSLILYVSPYSLDRSFKEITSQLWSMLSSGSEAFILTCQALKSSRPFSFQPLTLLRPTSPLLFLKYTGTIPQPGLLFP